MATPFKQAPSQADVLSVAVLIRRHYRTSLNDLGEGHKVAQRFATGRNRANTRFGLSILSIGVLLFALAVLGALSLRQHIQLRRLKTLNLQETAKRTQTTWQLVEHLARLQDQIETQIDDGIARELHGSDASSPNVTPEQLQTVRQSLDDLAGQVRRLDEAGNAAHSGDAEKELADRLGQLSEQLESSRRQLEQLTARFGESEQIVAAVSGGVCLIQGEYMFVDPKTDLPLRYLQAEPRQDVVILPDQIVVDDGAGRDARPSDLLPVSSAGQGDPLVVRYTATGFLVDPRGYILTNGHVTKPWRVSRQHEHLLEAGYLAKLCLFQAFFPGRPESVNLEVIACRDEEDLALLGADISGSDIPPLTCRTDPNGLRAGQTLIVLGYPTGLDALLARMNERDLDSIVGGSEVSFDRIARNMARQGLIEPIATRGICGMVSPSRLVYDAQTAVGASGAPVIGPDGKVVAINTALLKSFGGTNFGIPIRRGLELLKDSVSTDLTTVSRQDAQSGPIGL